MDEINKLFLRNKRRRKNYHLVIKNCNFSGSNLTGCVIFENSIIDSSLFAHSIFVNCCFKNSTMDACDFYKSIFDSTNFSGCKIEGMTYFVDTRMPNTNFGGSILTNTVLSHADVSNVFIERL